MKIEPKKDSPLPDPCSTKKTSYQDVIVSSIGEFGLSQLLIVLACKLPLLTTSWSMIMMSFAGAQPDWWSVVRTFNQTDTSSSTTRYYLTCVENSTIEYDTSIYTIVSEWNLVCSRKWIPPAISTTQMVGVLVGAAVTGQLGDWIGRQKSVLLVYTMDVVFTMVQAFASSWEMMIVVVFFIGFSLGGFLVIIQMFMLEFVGTKWRTITGVIPFWGTGVMLFGIMFKVLPNWRHLCIVTALLGAPIILLLWFVPESIRWLFGQGRYEEGKVVLRRLAKRNKLPEPDLSALDEIMEKEIEDEKHNEKHTYFTLLKLSSTRKKAIVLAFMWFYMGFGYYGLTLGVSKLSGDITLNMIIMGLGEMSCLIMCWLITKCLGRRNTTIVLMLGTGVTSLAVTIAYFTSTPTSFKLYMNVFALMSRFFLSAAWLSVILFTIETFPTVIRGVAYGFCSVSARIGGIAGTQNSSLMLIAVHLPFTINGIFGIISACLCLLLVDTYEAPLEDHIDDSDGQKKIISTPSDLKPLV